MDIYRSEHNERFVQALCSGGARFLVIGGTAVAHYVSSRRPDDLDLLIDGSATTATAVLAAFRAFQPCRDFVQELTQPGTRATLPPPCHGDILTPKGGQDFAGFWERRSPGRVGSVALWMLSRADLIVEKQRSAKASMGLMREKDLADIALLQECDAP